MTDKQKIINRLKRAEGQLRGVQTMLDQENECIDIITQLSAVRSSVDRIMGIILADNLKKCIENPDRDRNIQQEKLERAIQMIAKK